MATLFVMFLMLLVFGPLVALVIISDKNKEEERKERQARENTDIFLGRRTISKVHNFSYRFNVGDASLADWRLTLPQQTW